MDQGKTTPKTWEKAIMVTLRPAVNIHYHTNYHSEGGSSPGHWAGRGALLLGLRGTIDTQEYHSVLLGYSPDRTTPLGQPPRDNHRKGFDLVFAADKSFSIALARADSKERQRLIEAQQKSVQVALSFIEDNVAITRRGHAGKNREHAAGLVATTFDHFSSREDDCHVHTHLILASKCIRNDSTWGTLDSRELYLWQRAISAIYRTALAKNLQKLNYSLKFEGDNFQIAGIPRDLCQKFSQRTHQIHTALKKFGQHKSTSRAGDIATLSTRKKKVNISKETLFDTWQCRLDKAGFTINEFQKVKQLITTSTTPLLIFDKNTLIENIHRKQAIFREMDIFREACELALHCNQSAEAAQRLAKNIILDSETISLGVDYKKSRLFTTKQQIESEQNMVKNAQHLAGQKGFALHHDAVQPAMNRSNFELSEEQQEAVYRACQSNRFSIIQGSAGAGKTASMRSVRYAYMNAGFKVIGAALSKVAAENLSAETGVTSQTIAKLIGQVEKGNSQLDHETVLLIDEAGLVEQSQLSTLLSAAKDTGCKIILIGEDKQLDAINKGGSLRYLSNPNIIGSTRIQNIRRQRSNWAQKSVADLRDGRTKSALIEHKKRGLIHMQDNALDTEKALLQAWCQFQNTHPHKKSLVLAQHWRQIKALNSHIRSHHQLSGTVGFENYTLQCAISDNKTMTCDFSLGERVRLCRNDYRRGFSNGMIGNITSIMRDGDDIFFEVQNDEGKSLRFSKNDYSNEQGHIYLTQAYAMTIFSSQGVTVDGDVFLLHNNNIDRAHAYVAGSRHKDKCHWFINKKEVQMLTDIKESDRPITDQKCLETLALSMSRDRYQSLAIEHIGQQDYKPNKNSLEKECLDLSF